MQIAGVPDIIGCYRGRFIAFECKRDATGKPTRLQAYMMKKIKDAGGIVRLIWSMEQTDEILNRLDAQALRKVQEAEKA